MGWGYWGPYLPRPGVSRYKWIEPRHLPHVCDRWAHDRTDSLQYAWFNGTGYESWENLWGIWNGVTPRDAEALRRISSVYRALPPDLLVSADYEPFTPMPAQDGVFATKFPGRDTTFWTFINRADAPVDGPQIRVPFTGGTRFFDLWRGVELAPELSADGSTATLGFELESDGYGAVLATTAESLPDSVKVLLTQMAARRTIRLADLSAEWKPLPQRIVEIAPTPPAARAPAGTVLIPAGTFRLVSTGIMIETSEGVGVQYPWEGQPHLAHDHELAIPAFYLDWCPVTCAEFKRFLDAAVIDLQLSKEGRREGQLGAMPQGFEQAGCPTNALEVAANRLVEVSQALGHEVGHAPGFEMAPDKPHRVQVRRVGRQPFEVQTRVTRTERPDQRPFVVGAPVPDDDHPPAQMFEEFAAGTSPRSRR